MQPSTCPLNHPHGEPRACAHCGRTFCAHEQAERRAYGSYHQYCSEACRDAKQTAIWQQGAAHFAESRIVLIVEEAFCYLVLNRHKVGGETPGYGFKILQQHRPRPDDTRLDLDYCHYPGFSTADHPVTYALEPELAVAVAVYDEHVGSMWTMVGFELRQDSSIVTFGVGGFIVVLDRRLGR